MAMSALAQYISRIFNRIGGVIVNVLASGAVDHGFIGGVIVNMLASSAVDHGFIGGVIVNVLASSAVDHGFIGGVIVNVLASSAVDHGFKPRLGQAKDYKIGIACFSAKHAALKSKSKDWLACNENNVSEWSDMSIRRLLFQ